MRGIMLAAALTTFGALAMSDTALADDKKMPNPTQDESYTEKVTVRVFLPSVGKLSTNAAKNVPAFRFEKDGVLKFYTRPRGGAPTVGTEITDEKDMVYVVEKVIGTSINGYYTLAVKPKPKE